MRRLTSLLALVALMVGSCSSSEPMSFDLAQPMEPPEVEVTISGDAVDEGVVCALGTFVFYRMEDMDGAPISMEGWDEIFDRAMDTASVAEAMSFNDYECGDGSGTIRVAQHVRFDFGVLTQDDLRQGEYTSGTWTIEGTGDYESLTGSGDIVNDGSTRLIHMVGEVEG